MDSDIKEIGPKYLCGNPLCTKQAYPTLQACSSCKSARYCSRGCQSEHWQAHKPLCKNNQLRTNSIKEAEGTFTENLEGLEATLKRWFKFHALNLIAAYIHALSLPMDIQRARTHLLRIRVTRFNKNNPLSAKWQTSFKIEDVAVLEQTRAKLLGSEWNNGLDQLAAIRIQDEQAGRGTVGVIAIQCEPLGVYFAPIGSLKDLGSVRILPGHWKLLLQLSVTAGHKFVSWESKLDL